MRLRTYVAAVAALLGAQAPAHAAPTSAHLDITFDITCFGCGVASATGAGTCTAPCVIEGAPCATACVVTATATASVPPGATCQVGGTLTGTLSHWGGSTTFTLTWQGAATMTLGGGATGGGVLSVVSPSGIPCGGPATVRFVGYVSGA